MYIKLLNREITASRWPWQIRTSVAALSGPDEKVGDRYGWKPTKGVGRFGGGWNWELGINIGGSTVVFNLLYGMISISKPRKCECCDKPILRGQKSGPWAEGGYTKHLACYEEEVATKKANDALEKALFEQPPDPPKAQPEFDDDIPF